MFTREREIELLENSEHREESLFRKFLARADVKRVLHRHDGDPSNAGGTHEKRRVAVAAE